MLITVNTSSSLLCPHWGRFEGVVLCSGHVHVLSCFLRAFPSSCRARCVTPVLPVQVFEARGGSGLLYISWDGVPKVGSAPCEEMLPYIQSRHWDFDVQRVCCHSCRPPAHGRELKGAWYASKFLRPILSLTFASATTVVDPPKEWAVTVATATKYGLFMK